MNEKEQALRKRLEEEDFQRSSRRSWTGRP